MGIGRDVNQSLLYMKPEKLVKFMKTKEGIIQTHYQEQKLIIKLVLYSLFFFAASEISMLVFNAPSRRQCNISWILFQCWICCSVFTMIFICDRITVDHSNQNRVIQSINLNALFTFVGSNLLCGLINITTFTLYFTFWQGLGMLYVYALVPTVLYGLCLDYNKKLAF